MKMLTMPSLQEPTDPVEPAGTSPEHLDLLWALYGSRNQAKGTFMWAGGVGDGTRTPPRTPEHIGPSSGGTSSKRASREQVVTSPEKKRSCNLGEYMTSWSQSIAERNSKDPRASREQQEQAEVMEMLCQDGVIEGCELYYMALDLFQKAVCQAQYKNIQEKEHRVKYIEWTWTKSKQNRN